MAATADVAAWSAALDEIEEGLRLADLVAQGASDLVMPAWQAPDGLGPLPAELAPRMRLVLAALDAVQHELVEARAKAVADLSELADAARVPGRRPAAADDPPAPSLVDHSA